MTSITDIITISLSVPALILCALVLAHWLPEAGRAVRERRDAADWLVLGVVSSFMGIIVNISWWSVYWGMRVLDHPSQGWLLDHGSFINIFSRQGAVIIAAWCHLKAYHLFSKGEAREPSVHLQWSMAVAGLLALTLIMTSGGFGP